MLAGDKRTLMVALAASSVSRRSRLPDPARWPQDAAERPLLATVLVEDMKKKRVLHECGLHWFLPIPRLLVK